MAILSKFKTIFGPTSLDGQLSGPIPQIWMVNYYKKFTHKITTKLGLASTTTQVVQTRVKNHAPHIQNRPTGNNPVFFFYSKAPSRAMF
jgi:hypothetical protein